MTHAPNGTIKLHRVLRAPAEPIYRAFLEPLAKARWLPPYGFVGEVHKSDVRVGGGYHMSFTNFRTGQSHSFSGIYHELTPFHCIRYSDRFDDPNMRDEMQVIVTLDKCLCGTELSIVQENIPSQIPAEMCYLGWQESLAQLALLVEPEIP